MKSLIVLFFLALSTSAFANWEWVPSAVVTSFTSVPVGANSQQDATMCVLATADLNRKLTANEHELQISLGNGEYRKVARPYQTTNLQSHGGWSGQYISAKQRNTGLII